MVEVDGYVPSCEVGKVYWSKPSLLAIHLYFFGETYNDVP